MRKLVYAFYHEGFSFAQFLRKYPEHRVNVINLLIGGVFRDGVDEVYVPMSEFAHIPPPLRGVTDVEESKTGLNTGHGVMTTAPGSEPGSPNRSNIQPHHLFKSERRQRGLVLNQNSLS
jgi:hypothetical protein